MKTILVDDELWSIEDFKTECAEYKEIEIVGTFSRSTDALEFAKNNSVEFALLDVEMPEINGLELARLLREMYPSIIIIFLSGYEQHIADAIRMKADFYLFKPYNSDDIAEVVKRAKLLSARIKKRVFIKTFGSFDVFMDGKPISFSSSKAKELLALLVDRHGGVLTNKEGFSYLWEDMPYDHEKGSAFRKVVGRLNDTLAENGLDGLIIKTKNGRYIDTSLFDCDYYSFLEGNQSAICEFNGEYMSNYSWGEFTLAKIWNMWQK